MLCYTFLLLPALFCTATAQSANLPVIRCDTLADPDRNTSNFHGHVFCVRNGSVSAVIKVSLDGHRNGPDIPFPIYPNASAKVHCYVVSDCWGSRPETKRFCDSFVGHLVQANTTEQKQAISDITLLSSPIKRFYHTDIISGTAEGKNAWIYESTKQPVKDLNVTEPSAAGLQLVYVRSILHSGYQEKPVNETGYFICQTMQNPPAANKSRNAANTEMDARNIQVKKFKPALKQSRSLSYAHHHPHFSHQAVHQMKISSRTALQMCEQMATLDPERRKPMNSKLVVPSKQKNQDKCGWYQRQQCGDKSCFTYSSRCPAGAHGNPQK